MVKGRVELDGPFEVCKEGEVLGSGQTTLLKIFGVATADFAVEVRAWWIRESGVVEVVGMDGEGGGGVRKAGNAAPEVELEGEHEELGAITKDESE